jgi:inorganic pyrophosphatase
MTEENNYMINESFWTVLDSLVKESEIIIDRPKGSKHPRYPDIIYSVDYGYLKGTLSQDGAGIDIWRGSDEKQRIDAIICTIDLIKKDSEIKILIGCTEDEKTTIYKFHNDSEFMKGIMIRRD